MKAIMLLCVLATMNSCFNLPTLFQAKKRLPSCTLEQVSLLGQSRHSVCLQLLRRPRQTMAFVAPKLKGDSNVSQP